MSCRVELTVKVVSVMYEVIGYRSLEGVSKKTGRPISAYILFLAGDGPQGTVGRACFEQYVDKSLVPVPPAVGSVVDIRYNRSGYVESIQF